MTEFSQVAGSGHVLPLIDIILYYIVFYFFFLFFLFIQFMAGKYRITTIEQAYRYKQHSYNYSIPLRVSVWVLIYAIMYFMIYSFALCLHLDSLLARLLSAHNFFYCYCFDNSRHFTCQLVFVVYLLRLLAFRTFLASLVFFFSLSLCVYFCLFISFI